MDRQTLLTALALLTGCAAGVYLRAGRSDPVTSVCGRLREAAWSTATVLTALALVTNMVDLDQLRYGYVPVDFAIPLAVAVALVIRPRLAFGLFPASLVVLSGYGLTAARNYGYWTLVPGHLSFLPLSGYDLQYYAVLPLSFALLAAGGWLGWRVTDRDSAAARLVIGPRLAGAPGQASSAAGLSLLLLPVAAMTAALIMPNLWFGPGAGGFLATAGIIAGTAAAIRRSPERAAALAVGGLLVLSLVSLVAASSWQGWPLPEAANGYVLDGVVAISGQTMSQLAILQAIMMAGLGLWLAPRSIPWARRLLGRGADADLTRRVQQLTRTRAEAVDTASAQLRRLERDLHDGAQARLVALGMHLRAAERLLPANPEAAAALIAEAREASARALTDLRELVRGVHPPVLADRGLADAIRALALDTPLRVVTEVSLPGRLPAPVETACYFAVAEILTNAVKHSGAREARISAEHASGLLRITVTDFGTGGADPSRGTGLAGVEKRLAAFDGILAVSSPVGGPTIIVIELPCAVPQPTLAR